MSNNNTLSIISSRFDAETEYDSNNNFILVKNIESWYEVAKFLKNDEKLLFDYLMCITSYDLGDNSTFGLAYNFYSTKLNHYNKAIFYVVNLLNKKEITKYNFLNYIFFLFYLYFHKPMRS